jgi:hypothetical protein
MRCQPLAPEIRSIRLLQLRKGVQQNVERELFHTTLDKIQYEAVSCTCSSFMSAETIQINREELGLTLNFSHLLHDLRRPEEARVLRIDAIYINQAGTKKRGEQVQLMEYIFAFVYGLYFT